MKKSSIEERIAILHNKIGFQLGSREKKPMSFDNIRFLRGWIGMNGGVLYCSVKMFKVARKWDILYGYFQNHWFYKTSLLLQSISFQKYLQWPINPIPDTCADIFTNVMRFCIFILVHVRIVFCGASIRTQHLFVMQYVSW